MSTGIKILKVVLGCIGAGLTIASQVIGETSDVGLFKNKKKEK